MKDRCLNGCVYENKMLGRSTMKDENTCISVTLKTADGTFIFGGDSSSETFCDPIYMQSKNVFQF